MPLNDVGRRYAERLFQNRLEEIQKAIVEKLSAVREDQAKRGLQRAGSNFAAQANVLVEQIGLLGQARAETLIKAYEKSDLPFDDDALREIDAEVRSYCHQQQHNAVGAIGNTMHQAYGTQGIPGGMDESIRQQIVNGVGSIMARISRDLHIRRDEDILGEMKMRRVYAAGLGKKWDVFISHASEDKESFVRPLANGLQQSGLSVWYDEFTLTVGDSLRRKIDEGLANSRYGIVILSRHFFEKNWPQHELDGLMTREIAGTKVILPVWHEISLEEIKVKSPMLAGLIAAKSDEGLVAVVRKLREAMGL